MNGIVRSLHPPAASRKDTSRFVCVVFVTEYDDAYQSHNYLFQDGHILRTCDNLKTFQYYKGFEVNTLFNFNNLCSKCEKGSLRCFIKHSKTISSAIAKHDPDVLSSSSHLRNVSCTTGAEDDDSQINSNNNRRLLDLLSRQSRSVIDVDMNAHLAGCVSKTLTLSPRFLRGFQKYVVSPESGGKYIFRRSKVKALRRRVDLPDKGCSEVEKPVIFCLIQIRLIYPDYHWLDLAWHYRLEELIIKRALLDDALNWLSTLGGAYSALGDYCPLHAENAARISVQQLRVALEMGSPPIIVRCHLYLGLSLMQRGKLRTAKSIIREQYDRAKTMTVIDTHLLSMCRGLWSRLRYLYSQRQTARHLTRNLQSTSLACHSVVSSQVD